MGRVREIIIRAFPPGPRRRHSFFAFALFVALWQYFAGIHAPYSFDDYKLIVQNPSIRELGTVGDVIASGRPIRGLTFMLDYALFGMNARGWHIVNFFWHAVVCVLIYLLLLRRFDFRTAVVAAILFSFTPIHAEAVIAISHRKELLAATFLLLSFHAFLYRVRWPRAALGLSLIFFLLGLLSKQVVAVLPLLLLGWEWLSRGPEGRREIWRFWPWVVLPAGLLLGGALASSTPILADFNFFGYFSPRDLTFEVWSRVFATTLAQVPRYFRCLLFPVHLSALPPEQPFTFSDPLPWVGLALLVATGVASWLTRRDRDISFGLLWFLVNLLPVLNLVPAGSVYADRYLYIPSIGFCLVMGGLYRRLDDASGELFSARSETLIGFALLWASLSIAIISALAGRLTYLWTFPEWWNMEPTVAITLTALPLAALVAGLLVWMHGPRIGPVINRRPAADFLLTYLMMCLLMFGSMILAEALVEHRLGFPDFYTEEKYAYIQQWLAIHARPGPNQDPSFFHPSGTTFSELGNIVVSAMIFNSLVVFFLFRFERLVAFDRRTRKLLIRLVFTIIIGYNGLLVWRSLDWVSEVRLWRTAVLENPNSLYANNNLGMEYLDRRRFDLATHYLTRATQLAPDQPEPWRNLGMAYLGSSQIDQAIAAYQQAVRLRPGDANNRLNLANLLVVQAEIKKDRQLYRQAIDHYLRILQAHPGYAHALTNIAICYYNLGAYPQALNYAERAIALDPVSPKPRELLSRIEEVMQGQLPGETPGQ